MKELCRSLNTTIKANLNFLISKYQIFTEGSKAFVFTLNTEDFNDIFCQREQFTKTMPESIQYYMTFQLSR